MHALSRIYAITDIRPAFADSDAQAFLLPEAPDQESDKDAALHRAEIIIRAQEERIQLLEDMALSDELTGLANRRGFVQAFRRELARADRDAAAAGVVIMVDLDGFKSINDRHGHQAGDTCLRATGQLLKDAVRATDIVARLGGDEFVMLLTHIEEPDAIRRLAAIEQNFNRRWLPWNGERLDLRASFGMSLYAAGADPDTVMQSADMRMYAHKARNHKLSGAA